MRSRFIWILAFSWMALLAASLAWNWDQADKFVMELARKEAQSHFEKDLLFRRWGALQGGVYVQPTEKTPPNPHLAFLKERDVVTTTGMALTLVNPAYMTRQIYELAAGQYGVQGHITSLKPLRPENRPDDWERQALLAFEGGVKEKVGLEEMGGDPFLRFMRPLRTEKACLKCHEAQGYKLGDVRGGIAIAVPFTPFTRIAEAQRRSLLIGHLAIGILGLTGLWAGGRRLKRSEDSLQMSLVTAEHMAAQQELLLSSLGEGVYGVNNKGFCIFINPSALAMLGLRKHDVIGKDQHQLFHSRKEDGSAYPHAECPIHLTLRDGVKRETEDAFLRDGELFPVRLAVTPMREGDAIVGAVVAFQDISERRQAEQQIRQLAYYDTLTGLPNRRLLQDRLRQAMAHARRHQHSLAVMFLDLDRFKQINDTLGHDAGDELLRQVATRLNNCVRAEDTVSRPGGDEFVIVLGEVPRPQDAALVAEKILAALRLPVDLLGQTVEVTTSIGIAVYAATGTDSIQELMRKADLAMYQAKESGRNGYRFYE
jgi:diguanylate cyclase (GGDEF)-like protein/PAS domain S-box-containing protein